MSNPAGQMRIGSTLLTTLPARGVALPGPTEPDEHADWVGPYPGSRPSVWRAIPGTVHRTTLGGPGLAQTSDAVKLGACHATPSMPLRLCVASPPRRPAWRTGASEFAGAGAGGSRGPVYPSGVTHAPRLVLERARRLLVVFAHPDDESFTTGGLIAAVAAPGGHVTSVTVTRADPSRLSR